MFCKFTQVLRACPIVLETAEWVRVRIVFFFLIYYIMGWHHDNHDHYPGLNPSCVENVRVSRYIRYDVSGFKHTLCGTNEEATFAALLIRPITMYETFYRVQNWELLDKITKIIISTITNNWTSERGYHRILEKRKIIEFSQKRLLGTYLI